MISLTRLTFIQGPPDLPAPACQLHLMTTCLPVSGDQPYSLYPVISLSACIQGPPDLPAPACQLHLMTTCLPVSRDQPDSLYPVISLPAVSRARPTYTCTSLPIASYDNLPTCIRRSACQPVSMDKPDNLYPGTSLSTCI
jgi:hypothetical protein